jgi:hypothetical protein
MDIPEWSPDIWPLIQTAVANEHKLTAIAAQFLTPPVPDSTTRGTVDANTVSVVDGALSVSDSATRFIVELSVPVTVKPNQVKDPNIAVSLATRAANLLARGEDLLICQGLDGLNDPFFASNPVTTNISKTPDKGIVVDSFLPADQKVPVEPVEVNSDPNLNVYGENTYAAVAEGYAKLQESHYGRQALILPTTIYADTYAARATTLNIPAITADRIKGLIGDNNNFFFFGTSALPSFDKNNAQAPAKGVIVALDGMTVDLVVQKDPTMEILTQEKTGANTGDYVGRVYERFALRLKDPKAVVELDFLPQKTATATKE